MSAMAKSGTTPSNSYISGETILRELMRNMELGKLEMAYTVLLPCVFSVYLHPDDHARLAGVQDIIKDDARRALNNRMAEWNRNSLFHRNAKRRQYRIAQNEWRIELFADGEGSVPLGDIEIHSELNDVVRPGYRGVKTTLLDRQPSITSLRVACDMRTTRRLNSLVFAEIRYQDDSGPQIYYVTQDEISIGRGGEDLWVDLPLYTNDEVSREHARLLREPSQGLFRIVDNSRNGTWLNGQRLKRGVEVPLSDCAEIGIAEVLKLSFNARK
jgi:hypothetical protein